MALLHYVMALSQMQDSFLLSVCARLLFETWCYFKYTAASSLSGRTAVDLPKQAYVAYIYLLEKIIAGTHERKGVGKSCDCSIVTRLQRCVALALEPEHSQVEVD